MADVFTVLAKDHQEVKDMLAELDKGPTRATGASQNQLALRKKMTQELIIEESKHEALEEMYFWPAVRENLPAGNTLADEATGQEQEAKQVLADLDKLDASEAEFEKLLAKFTVAARQHIEFEETQVWPGLRVRAHRRDRDRTRRQDRRRQEQRSHPAASAHAPHPRRTQGGGTRGGRDGQGPRHDHRPRHRLTPARPARLSPAPGVGRAAGANRRQGPRSGGRDGSDGCGSSHMTRPARPCAAMKGSCPNSRGHCYSQDLNQHPSATDDKRDGAEVATGQGTARGCHRVLATQRDTTKRCPWCGSWSRCGSKGPGTAAAQGRRQTYLTCRGL